MCPLSAFCVCSESGKRPSGQREWKTNGETRRRNNIVIAKGFGCAASEQLMRTAAAGTEATAMQNDADSVPFIRLESKAIITR